MQDSLKYLKRHKFAFIMAFASVILYYNFAYHLVRTDYTKLIVYYIALFVLFYKLIHSCSNNTKLLTVLAFLFRAVFIVSLPNLSQDFYRFIWDGRLILEGYNPYLFNVESFIKNGNYPIAQAKELYIGMGELNAGHYTNYPPLNQLCFLIAALVSKTHILGSVITMRLLIIAADFGTLYFGQKLLKLNNLPISHIFWYALNPFIIIELTGNLHFEGVMIFFLIWSLYLLHRQKWIMAAIILALSVATKLLPLLFMPLFIKWFIRKDTNHGIFKLIGFYSITGIATLLLFLPFLSTEFVNNYTETIGLWFQDFEFNASIYYIARAIGYTVRGYNEIAIIGKFIPLLVILFVLGITFYKRNTTTIQLTTSMLLALSFYYFTATTVHPWYIATLLILSIFTNYKFPLVWSFVIILSYLAYTNTNNSENLWVVTLEYVIVYAVFIWEVILNKKVCYFNKQQTQ
ncbi:mannosyltransferase [Aestuariibaculum sediminum]|uniref:Mannosyltransferase n=1 Tax=Aestuariibaculum sediminum TaxID=2770637 RepID=A0A8J6U6Q4_9FLAO|nr:mannosyltransferase [Aestuariibaculum sediminum]MBD0830788.1 mannosyltransferase [Aestuariibaculum sediminum]